VKLKTNLGTDAGLSSSIQDYLKWIYELTESGGAASTTALAARLAVAPASVTGMVQKLAAAKHPLIQYRKHQGVKLTRQGRLAALEVIRHHRLIETWLARSLGYPWDAVHGEAEELEHVISEDFERRISAALGNPARDPHGEPIPSAALIMPKDRSVPLARMLPSQEAVVRRVEAHEPDLLRYLDTIGVVIGAKLRVLEISRYDEISRVRLHGESRRLTLGPAITHRVFVEPVGAPPVTGNRRVRSRAQRTK